MVGLAAEAARSHEFDEKSLRLSIAEIAHGAYGDGATVNEALEEGWKRGVAHAMADGILTQAEEVKLREFRDRLALDSAGAGHRRSDFNFAMVLFLHGADAVTPSESEGHNGD